MPGAPKNATKLSELQVKYLEEDRQSVQSLIDSNRKDAKEIFDLKEQNKDEELLKILKGLPAKLKSHRRGIENLIETEPFDIGVRDNTRIQIEVINLKMRQEIIDLSRSLGKDLQTLLTVVDNM